MGLSHLAIANALDEFKVVAVSDLNRLVGRSIARFTASRYIRDYRDLLRDPEVDAVLVSVPTHLHFPVARAALDQGKHVFLEKPLTLSADSSRRLAEQAREARLATQVGYVNRLNPVFEHLRTMILEGTYGAPVEYECAMRGNVVGDEGAQGWRNDHRFGGGCLYEYGSHCIDLALFLFGHFASLDSAALTRIVSADVEDRVSALVTHKNDLRGRLEVDWADKSFRKATNAVSILTEKALIVGNKQEIVVFDHPSRGLDLATEEAGSRAPDRKVNVTDLDATVPYYLRGEEFTRQLLHFHELITAQATGSVAQFSDGAEIDRLISEILAARGQ